eukprot:6189599-Pleurochrysis_carterae.AAC.3
MMSSAIELIQIHSLAMDVSLPRRWYTRVRLKRSHDPCPTSLYTAAAAGRIGCQILTAESHSMQNKD